MISKIEKIKAVLKACAMVLYIKLVKQNSRDEDTARIEFILNTILLMSLLLVTAAFSLVIHNSIIEGGLYKGNPPFYIGAILALFVALLVLSRMGFIKIASYGAIVLYFLPIVYGTYYFGIDQPQTLLSYTIIIVIAGILLGTRVSFILTLAISATFLVFGYLQIGGILPPHSYWRQEELGVADVIIFAITFFILAVVSWLSNREIEKSLIRARSAEKGLREERDMLEIKVKERTNELERVQLEKTKQMQNFVEFGRLASGLFHDMVNPVQAAILSLHNLKQFTSTNSGTNLKSLVDETLAQMEKARAFINMARTQIMRQEVNIHFDPEEQIALVFQMLSFRAKREKVELVYSPHKVPVSLVGNPTSFNRLIAGLVTNAIDAYDDTEIKGNLSRTVTIAVEEKDGMLLFSVADNGKGISKENQKKIFGLFFTTKGIEKGTGVGLVLCKEIAEKEFYGDIDFNSGEGVGTTFVVKIPIKG